MHRWTVGGVLIAAVFAAVPSGAAKSADPEQGAAVFASAGCVRCHGPAGMGTDRGPSLREVRKRRSAAELQRQIKEGGQSMPAFGEVLTEAQITSLVEFLRSRNAWKKPLPVVPAQQ